MGNHGRCGPLNEKPLAMARCTVIVKGFRWSPNRRWHAVKLELIQSHMAQKPVLRGEVGCACVAREVACGMAMAPVQIYEKICTLGKSLVAQVFFCDELVMHCLNNGKYRIRFDLINIEALCAAPPEALAHRPSQMPLSCQVAEERSSSVREACFARALPLGVSPKGSVGGACVCWACLKIGREGVCLISI